MGYVLAMRTWQASWDSYIANVDDALASILLDLNVDAPVAALPLRVQVRVKLLSPRPDGLRDRSEAEAINNLEDDIVARVESALDAVFVARMLHNGYSEMFFYAPSSSRSRADDLAPVLGELGPYRAEWLAEDDAEWSLYREFLYPDVYAMHSITNRRLVDQIRSHGDAVDVPREIDHTASFASRGAAEQAVRALAAKGFRCDDIEEEEEGRFAVQFYGNDTISEERADVFTRDILDVVLPLEGDYDGWGCVIVKP